MAAISGSRVWPVRRMAGVQNGWLAALLPRSAVGRAAQPDPADIANPILWEAEAEGLHRDDRGLKGGCTD